MITLIDSHAHLDDPKFEGDRESVIHRAQEAGLKAILTVGTVPDAWMAVWTLCQEYDFVYPVLGVHPNDLGGMDDKAWAAGEEWLRAHPPKAIGETGLDDYWKTVPRGTQELYFRRHIRLARTMNLPLVIHCRDAYEDCLRLLREEGGEIPRGVLHCFSGGPDVARQAADMGLFLSFAGQVTYPKNDSLRNAARQVPLSQLLVETDCPYLAPQPRRGQRNEPAFVRFTAETIAGVRGMSLEELAGTTTANAERFFQLP